MSMLLCVCTSQKSTFFNFGLRRPATLLKVTHFHGFFSRFLNCTNVTKSRKASQILGVEKHNYTGTNPCLIYFDTQRCGREYPAHYKAGFLSKLKYVLDLMICRSKFSLFNMCLIKQYLQFFFKT